MDSSFLWRQTVNRGLTCRECALMKGGSLANGGAIPVPEVRIGPIRSLISPQTRQQEKQGPNVEVLMR